jgi:basic membrane protein A
MGMEASSPAIPQTCEKNGAYVVGYHNDMSELAPDAVLVSFTWNFAPIFKQIMESVQDGTVSTDDYYYLGGECAKLTDFASFVPDDVVAAVDDLKAKIDSGEVQVYAGELKDDEGNVLVNEGEVMDDETILLQEFFVDNVDCAW